jgi:hypothetical protein
VGPPPPPPPTPLDPPAIYYSLQWRVPPLVVKTKEEADALDPKEWTADPGPAPGGRQASPPKEDYPKLYYNVNVPPQTVGTADAETALGSEWKEYQFTEALLTSAWKNFHADQAYQKAQDARSQAGQPGSTPQQPSHP